jgi:hypothetical protein
MPAALRKLEDRPVRFAASEAIREVKFIEMENGALQISAFLKDGSTRIIHQFNPHEETWRQFEFDGLTLAEAKSLLDSREKPINEGEEARQT